MEKLAAFPQKYLAEKLKITPAAVSKWFKKGRVPVTRAFDLEKITGVSRHDLRPDIFGPSPTQPVPVPAPHPVDEVAA